MSAFDDWIMRIIAIIALMLAIRAWEDARMLQRSLADLRRLLQDYRSRIERLEASAERNQDS